MKKAKKSKKEKAVAEKAPLDTQATDTDTVLQKLVS